MIETCKYDVRKHSKDCLQQTQSGFCLRGSTTISMIGHIVKFEATMHQVLCKKTIGTTSSGTSTSSSASLLTTKVFCVQNQVRRMWGSLSHKMCWIVKVVVRYAIVMEGTTGSSRSARHSKHWSDRSLEIRTLR